MRVGYYPGSFNPWHLGHEDILKKALLVFDKVVVGIGYNPEKDSIDQINQMTNDLTCYLESYGKDKVKVERFNGLLVDHMNFIAKSSEFSIVRKDWKPTAIIRGLRNGYNVQYEANQQYWNEDLGLSLPVVFFITDRNLAHVSSTAIHGIRSILKHPWSDTPRTIPSDPKLRRLLETSQPE